MIFRIAKSDLKKKGIVYYFIRQDLLDLLDIFLAFRMKAKNFNHLR